MRQIKEYAFREVAEPQDWLSAEDFTRLTLGEAVLPSCSDEDQVFKICGRYLAERLLRWLCEDQQLEVEMVEL